jgi:hypothetical protein
MEAHGETHEGSDAAQHTVAPNAAPDHDEALRLIAYDLLPERFLPELIPAKRARRWMLETNQSFANRCLALLMANQNGWWLLNRIGFTATWDGSARAKAISIEYDDPSRDLKAVAESRFGYGILSWPVPYLFRTPQGWNLISKGPANMPKDGIAALEGLVESDWAEVTFTMNWKFTRPDHPVRFEAGEPFAMLVPHQRGALEAMTPERRYITDAPEILHRMRDWVVRRQEEDKKAFLESYFPGARGTPVWDGGYMKGTRPDASPFEGHQRVMDLKSFDLKS